MRRASGVALPSRVALLWGACGAFGVLALGGCAPNGSSDSEGATPQGAERPGAERPGAEPADAPGGATPPAAMAAGADCVTGTVTTGGTQFAPLTVIRVEGAGGVAVQGPLTARVRLLAGTLVTACGTRSSSPERIEPARLELREVDGMTAYLGTLEQRGAGWRLVPDDAGLAVPLSSAPAALGDAAGQTVWVAGAWAGDVFQVQSFGVLEGWR